jgi:hypothetical protein
MRENFAHAGSFDWPQMLFPRFQAGTAVGIGIANVSSEMF